MYEIEARIYEKHGEYQVYLSTWSVETMTKTRIATVWVENLEADPVGVEEWEFVHEVIMSALRRHAREIDRALPWRFASSTGEAGTAGGGVAGNLPAGSETLPLTHPH